MDPEDTPCILKLTGRNHANYTSSTFHPNTVGDGTLGATLSDKWDRLDNILKRSTLRLRNRWIGTVTMGCLFWR